MSRFWPILAIVLLNHARPGAVPAARAQHVEPPRITSQALFHIALEARRRGEEQLAAGMLESVVRLDPGAVLPRLEWAESLLTLQEPELVEALLMPVADRIVAEAGDRPDSASRYFRIRGNAAARAGRSEDALELYEQAIDLAPEDLGLRGLVISMYRSGGDDDAAARHLLAAASLRPGDADLRIEAGRALVGVRRFAEAEEEFRIALRIDLWAVRAWQGLGESLIGQRKWVDAEEVFRGAIRLAPDSAPLHELLGDALLADGRTKEALLWYRRAAALPEADARALAYKIEQAQARLRP